MNRSNPVGMNLSLTLSYSTVGSLLSNKTTTPSKKAYVDTSKSFSFSSPLSLKNGCPFCINLNIQVAKGVETALVELFLVRS